MPHEELIQRRYIRQGEMKGDPFGLFESFDLGSTTARELQRVGLLDRIPETVDFPFSQYKAPRRIETLKPDSLYVRRTDEGVNVVAVKEVKGPTEFDTARKQEKACEQALVGAAVCGAAIAVATDGSTHIYIDVTTSLQQRQIVKLEEHRDFNPGILADLVSGKPQATSDPSVLAERVWQAIWHATKKDPKPCLMSFVEIFILKFLSDNLPQRVLPEAYSFYELTRHDSKAFQGIHGKTKIEYYVQDIRPRIKSIFPDKTVVSNRSILELFGLSTLISETSVINAFAFLSSGNTSLATFDRTFVDILEYFQDFGPLTEIDPEFKLRLYETFLKKTPNKQKLGQFFTPRNIVRTMIRMARLNCLPDGAIVLDPAAGVGGFILEPLLQEEALAGNISFVNGRPRQRVRLIGLDVDTDTHILAKANTLIHVAEMVRDPKVTVNALNELATELFLNVRSNCTGSA